MTPGRGDSQGEAGSSKVVKQSVRHKGGEEGLTLPALSCH